MGRFGLDLVIETEEERRKEAFIRDWLDTLELLQEIDPDWEAWYDGRPEQTKGEMLPLMKERIEFIQGSPGLLQGSVDQGAS